MNKITAVIIDDEKNGRENLTNSLLKYCPEIEIIAEVDSVMSGIEAIQKFTPELIFLDIEMPDGKGFKVLEFFPDATFDVIFVTAYDHYAIDAIRFSALDYILKPINVLELRAAINRLEQRKIRNNQLIRQFIQNADSALAEKKLALATSDKIEFRKIGQIVRCQSEGNYTHFYFADGSSLLVSRTLNEFEEILERYGFFRTHKTHLVNSMFINAFHKSDGGYLKMTDGTSVPISRRRKEEILERFKNL